MLYSSSFQKSLLRPIGDHGENSSELLTTGGDICCDDNIVPEFKVEALENAMSRSSNSVYLLLCRRITETGPIVVG